MQRVSTKTLRTLPIGTIFAYANDLSVVCRKVEMNKYVKFTILGGDGNLAVYNIAIRATDTLSIYLIEPAELDALISDFHSFVSHTPVEEVKPPTKATTAKPAAHEMQYIPPREMARLMGITVDDIRKLENKRLPGWPARFQLSPKTTRYKLKDVQEYIEKYC